MLFDLQTLAWQADITRVSTLMIAREISGTTYPGSGVRDAFHNLSHHSKCRRTRPLRVLNTYHVTQVNTCYKLRPRQMETQPAGSFHHSLWPAASRWQQPRSCAAADRPLRGGSGRLQGGATSASRRHAAAQTCMRRCWTSWAWRPLVSVTAMESSPCDHRVSPRSHCLIAHHAAAPLPPYGAPCTGCVPTAASIAEAARRQTGQPCGPCDAWRRLTLSAARVPPPSICRPGGE